MKFVDMNVNQRGRHYKTKKPFPTTNKNTGTTQEMVVIPRDEYFMLETKLKVLSDSKFVFFEFIRTGFDLSIALLYSFQYE